VADLCVGNWPFLRPCLNWSPPGPVQHYLLFPCIDKFHFPHPVLHQNLEKEKITDYPISRMKERIKQIIKKLPIRFTKNQRYDYFTKKIIRAYCSPDSNCIDAGTHKGEIMDLFIQYAPDGRHYGFEPIPDLFSALKKKYKTNRNCIILPYALSSIKEKTSFNYVTTNPAYSGLKKRKYDKPEKEILITVQTERLDDVIPLNLPIKIIKIDVEGAELGVMQGAAKLLSKHKPLLIFETGVGGSDVYGTTPEKIFAFLSGLNYSLNLLDRFLDKKPALSEKAFCDQFYNRKNYYFIAS
jgi:FkbM family methyltransferase